MKRKLLTVLLSVFMLMSFAAPVGATFAAETESPATDTEEARSAEDKIGVTITGGYYEFDPSVSCLEDGANRIQEMGAKVIKLWLSEQTLAECYPYNTDWSQWEINNCVDILKTDYFQNVLNMDFQTYIFETHPFDSTQDLKTVDWTDGMTEEDKVRTEEEMYQITKYLMIQYVGSGKEFVLQNWEGDNALDARHWRFNSETQQYYQVDDNGSVVDEGEAADERIRMQIRALTEWFNCRQAGVDRAMEEFGEVSDVVVRHALEINFTYLSPSDAPYPYGDSPMLLNTVVPFTDCDLYSYSCWSAQWLSRANTFQARLDQYEEAIGDYYYDIDDQAKEHPIARRPMMREDQKSKIMIGEYGAPERMQGSENSGGALTDELNYTTNRLQRQTVQIQTDIALKHGCEYVVYWELYCNVADPNVTINAASGEQAETNYDVQGNWLIRADGTFTETYKYFSGLVDPDATYIREEYSGDGVYEIDGESGGFEISTVLNSDAPLSNLTGERNFDNKITVQGSADGKTYQDIEIVGFYKDTEEANGKYTSSVSYINKEPVDTNYRYFKVTSNASSEELQLGEVKFYKPTKDKLLKMKVFGSVNEGEETTQNRYTLESGDEIQLRVAVGKENWGGKVEYATSNRYIASVSDSGLILGRTNGIALITVTVSGDGFETPVTSTIEVTVRTLGEELIHDSFTDITTIGYEDNNVKTPGTELDGFGEHMFGTSAMQYFIRTDNIQFFRMDESVSWLYQYFDNDPWMAYILDWTKPSGYIVYESEEDIGSYDIGMSCYGQNALDRIQVFVSADDENYQEINSYVQSSTPLPSGYYDMRISNRQVIPEGMRYIKIQIRYTDANKWTPQLYDLKLYGEAAVDGDYVDTVYPTLNVDGSYPETVKPNDVVTLLPATYSDDFATLDELEYTVRVFMVMDNGMQSEVAVEDGKFTITAYGEYKVEYSVTDLAGNKTTKTFTMQCSEDTSSGNETGGCNSTVMGISTALSAVALVGTIGLTFIIKKRFRKE